MGAMSTLATHTTRTLSRKTTNVSCTYLDLFPILPHVLRQIAYGGSEDFDEPIRQQLLQVPHHSTERALPAL